MHSIIVTAAQADQLAGSAMGNAAVEATESGPVGQSCSVGSSRFGPCGVVSMAVGLKASKVMSV